MMLAFAQTIFLVMLAGTVLWLAYLGRHQDLAAGADSVDQASRPAGQYGRMRSPRRS